MQSIITGDIIGSRKTKSNDWIIGLKQIFNIFGDTPKNWDIYRGDEFQLEIKDIKQSILIAIQVKAYLKSIKLDARMCIGIGDKTYSAEKISESNGSSFVYSGEGFDSLRKEKVNLKVNSKNLEFNEEINLLLKLGLSFMDSWTSQTGEYVLVAIQNPKLSQEEIGNILGINQAAVSRRRKRANFDLLMEINNAFIKKLKHFN